MSGNPLDIFKEFDPKILEYWSRLQGLTYSEGALSVKTKLLIALAIDTVIGSADGATVLGQRAINAGATKDEIIETLRIAYSIAGNPALFTSAKVLHNLFKQTK